MKNKNDTTEVLHPKNQLKLFNFENLFHDFDKLFKKNKLPNTILLSGSKGVGKSTFVFHFSNYLFSRKEGLSYALEDFKIIDKNKSYNLVKNNLHTNFYFLESKNSNDKVKVDQVRGLLNFANKSSFSEDLKIILIDNAELLNKSSANALLKIIEEPNRNTFFFIIQNKSANFLNTIKSRCIEFKVSFTIEDKMEIFRNLANQYTLEFNEINSIENLHYETHGNLLKYNLGIHDYHLITQSDNLKNIYSLIKIIENDKVPDKFNFLQYFVEKFYKDICYKNMDNFNKFNNYINNYKQIINQINNMKNFNLNEKNTLSLIRNTLPNE